MPADLATVVKPGKGEGLSVLLDVVDAEDECALQEGGGMEGDEG